MQNLLRPLPLKPSALAAILALVVGLGGPLPAAGQPGADAAQPAASPRETLDQLRKDARADPQRTARALAALHPERMNAEDRATWVRLSREAALRNGDLATLQALKHQPDPFALRPLSRLLLANAHLNEADLAAARAELDRVGPLAGLNTRDQRRYWALRARLGQLEGLPGEELEALERIVDELAHWPSADCQSCHNDPKAPAAVPLLEIADTWYGRRFVALLKARGDAGQARLRAEQRLQGRPDDTHARIVLGYALLAEGRPDEAARSWAAVPWLATPGRPGGPVRMMFAWP